MRKIALALAAAAAFSISVPAQAATELVTNGGFESGGFSPPNWTITGTITGSVSTLSSDVHSGNYGFSTGPIGTTASIEQILTTDPGQSYTVSFWLRLFGGTPNSFDVSFGGVSLFSLVDSPGFGYTQYSFTATAPTSSTALRFTFRNDPSFWAIDDISVQAAAVPEPATWAMMLIGFGAIGASMRLGRRRGRSSLDAPAS